MTKADKNAVLGAAAKTLAWELYAAAAYGRTRPYLDVERFERLFSAARQWGATQKNLKKEGEAMQQAEANRPFWRQGDIFFVKIDEEVNLSEGTPLKNGVIAEGEQTGHAHRASPSSIAAGAILVALGRYLRAPEAGASIVHDEHGPIQLPSGTYAVVRQQEFDGLRWRQVWD